MKIQRRELIKSLAAAGIGGASILSAQTPRSDIKRVLVMFKCHLDVGFTDTQAGVMRKYFDVYYPAAMARAAEMQKAGADRYAWTTGSWLVYEYLEQANVADRKRMEQALNAGDIAWHALPYSFQTEVFDRTMISGITGFSKSLDQRFGRKTTGAKMTDVPGHTLGLIAPLAENGVKFLHIGVNSASTPPQVPSLFVWKDATGASIVVMYQHKGYGGNVVVPGTDLAIAVAMGDDNTGPHTLDEIKKIYADLRKEFPAAKITATNMSEIANAVDAHRSKLPVVTDEIGDTWIHGVPSDPIKVARYREVARLRREWITKGQWKVGDPADLSFLRRFALFGEHTWGVDTKTYLDHDHYTPKDLIAALEKPGYKKMTTSWAEKRKNIDDAVATLPSQFRQQAVDRLAALKPVEPSISGMKPWNPKQEFESSHFAVAIDEKTGAIRRLWAKASGREWASAQKPLALFSYQTFSAEDYAKFLDSYVTSKADWAPQDFGKPNIAKFGAKSRTWTPKLAGCWSSTAADGDRIVAKIQIDDPTAERSGVVAWPAAMYLELFLPKATPQVHLSFSIFHKKANRMPEALWLTFQPEVPDPKGWTMEKSDHKVSPFAVVKGGNRHIHALSSGLSYRGSKGSFTIDSLDAPVIALGVKSPIYYSEAQPDIAQGIHFSLYNNGWGTNYIQWFGEDARFRFQLRE